MEKRPYATKGENFLNIKNFILEKLKRAYTEDGEKIILHYIEKMPKNRVKVLYRIFENGIFDTNIVIREKNKDVTYYADEIKSNIFFSFIKNLGGGVPLYPFFNTYEKYISEKMQVAHAHRDLPLFTSPIEDIKKNIISKLYGDKKISPFYTAALKRIYDNILTKKEKCKELFYKDAELKIAKISVLKQISRYRDTNEKLIYSIFKTKKENITLLTEKLKPYIDIDNTEKIETQADLNSFTKKINDKNLVIDIKTMYGLLSFLKEQKCRKNHYALPYILMKDEGGNFIKDGGGNQVEIFNLQRKGLIIQHFEKKLKHERGVNYVSCRDHEGKECIWMNNGCLHHPYFDTMFGTIAITDYQKKEIAAMFLFSEWL
ncbi:MAG: hypothetical protein QM526_01655 [Alphaproteobacteria bacterium]|nr:hypothetical protein [Alphaproteobacteria bacterium]